MVQITFLFSLFFMAVVYIYAVISPFSLEKSQWEQRNIESVKGRENVRKSKDSKEKAINGKIEGFKNYIRM